MMDTPEPIGPIYSTDEDLVRAVAMWQKRLRMMDWEIIAELVHPTDRGCALGSGEVGRCMTTVNYRKAHIQIRRLEAYDNPVFPYDMEKTLVHELLHVPFEGLRQMISDDEASAAAQEPAIENLAMAIVAIVRGQSA